MKQLQQRQLLSYCEMAKRDGIIEKWRRHKKMVPRTYLLYRVSAENLFIIYALGHVGKVLLVDIAGPSRFIKLLKKPVGFLG